MDEQTIQRKWREQRAEITQSLDRHIAALSGLVQANGINFDVLTDVDPTIMYDTRSGAESLRFWQDLYNNLSTAPAYTVIRRYVTGPDPSNTSRNRPHVVTSIQYNVFKGLLPADISFIKGDETQTSRIVVNHPSHVIRYVNPSMGDISRGAADVSQPMLLFEQRPTPPTQEQWLSLVSRPLLLEEPEIFYAATVGDLARMAAPHIGKVGDDYGAYLPGSEMLDRYIAREQLAQILLPVFV